MGLVVAYAYGFFVGYDHSFSDYFEFVSFGFYCYDHFGIYGWVVGLVAGLVVGIVVGVVVGVVSLVDGVSFLSLFSTTIILCVRSVTSCSRFLSWVVG